MDAGVFKKKARRGGAATARKRPRDEDAGAREHARDEGEEALAALEELREDQRLRATRRRAEPRPRRAETAAASERRAPAQYGLHDPKKDGAPGQKLLHLLDGQFTGQSGVTPRDQYEELANKYVEERLQSKRESADDDTPSHGHGLALTDEDALYAELRSELGGPKAAPESVDGGVLVWNTGIAEVELPATYHEKTLLETKKALERERAASQRTVASSALPANFSTDFNRHKSDFLAELKSLSKEEQRERGFVAAPKRDKPSDDQAVARFRKMESRRRHN